jgi:D-amino-acid dehydrogenase
LFIAGGHAMLGLSLGPATGKLISEVISGYKTSVDVAAFNVNRYN